MANMHSVFSSLPLSLSSRKLWNHSSLNGNPNEWTFFPAINEIPKAPEEDTPEIHGKANLWTHAWRVNTHRHTHTDVCVDRTGSPVIKEPSRWLFFTVCSPLFQQRGMQAKVLALWSPLLHCFWKYLRRFKYSQKRLNRFLSSETDLRKEKRKKAQFSLLKVECVQDFSSGGDADEVKLEKLKTAVLSKCGNQGKPRSHYRVNGVPISV